MVNPVQSKGPKGKKWRYCVVRFIKPPKQCVDKYLCLPYSWITCVSSDGEKAMAAYPPVEHPDVTRQRVRTGNKCRSDWRMYAATIKYRCDSYNDAEKWIAIRTDEENSAEFKDTELESVVHRTLRSTTRSSKPTKDNQSEIKNKNKRKPLPRVLIKRPELSKPTNKVVRKFTKQSDSTRPTRPNENNSSNTPGPSKQLTIDNTLRRTDTDDSDVAIITKKDIKTSLCIIEDKPDQPSVSHTIQSTSSKNSDKIVEKCLDMPLLNDYDLVIVDQETQPESNVTRKPSSTQSSPHTLEQQFQLPLIQKKYYLNDGVVKQFKNQYLQEVTAKDPNPVSDKGQKTDTNSNTVTAVTTNSMTTVNKSTELNQSTPLPLPTLRGLSYRDFKLRKIRGEIFTQEFHNNKESNHQVISNIPCSSQNLSSSQIAKKDMSPLPMCPMGNQAQMVTEYQEEIPPDNTHSIQSNINNQGFILPNTAQSSLIDKRHITTSAVNHADLETCHQDNIAAKTTSQNHYNSAYQLRWSMQPLNIQQNLLPNSGIVPQVEDGFTLLSENHTYQNHNPFDMRNQILATLQSNLPNGFPQHNENQQIPIDQGYLQKDGLGAVQSIMNTLSHHTDQRPQTRNGLDETSTVKNPACLPNEPQQYSQLLQPMCVQNCTQESRNPITKGQKPGLQGVTKNTPPVASKSANSLRQSPQSVQRRNLMLDPRIQRRLNERSTVQNHKAGPILPQYIMTEPIPTTSNFETLRTSIRKSHETYIKSAYQSPIYVNTPTFKLVDRTTQTAKRVRFKEGIVESPAMKRPRMVLNGVTQADVSLPNNTQHQFVPGLNSVLNDEDIADNETTAEETPFVRNNAESTPLVMNSTEEPTYDQSKLSKIKASSEVLEGFAKFDACFGKMVSNLSNMCNSFLNMQNFVHQSVKQMEGRVKAYHESL